MHDPDDRQHFGDMLRGLAASTKGQVTNGVLMVYWMALKDISVPDFDRAIGRAVNECEWFPSVRELREMGGCKKAGPVPLYLRPVEDELERIETCSYHVAQGGATAAPTHVPWCRKCRRLQIRAQRGGPPKQLGELLATYGQLEAKK